MFWVYVLRGMTKGMWVFVAVKRRKRVYCVERRWWGKCEIKHSVHLATHNSPNPGRPRTAIQHL